jgi:hypothetical protein
MATAKFNLDKYASLDPFVSHDIKDLELKIAPKTLKAAKVSFTIGCQFIKDGKAT